MENFPKKDRKEYLPKPNYTKSYWLRLEENDEFSTIRTTPELPKEVDVLIIGSGYAGTSVANYLYEENPSLKVAMFEARNICSGATGRNGGHVKPYCHRNYDKYEKTTGSEAGVAEIVNSEYEHIWIIKKLVEDNKIDCDFFLTRAMDVYPDRSDPRIKIDYEAAQRMLANPYVSSELKKQFQIVKGENARIISKNDKTDIAFSYPAATCWPWKLMTGLLKILSSKGDFLNIQTNTCVTDVVKTKDDKWEVITPRGSTIAKNVVYCTNGFTKGLLEEFGNVIVPQKGTCCSIKPIDPSSVPHLTNNYGIFTARPNSQYLINRMDGTVIVGGFDEKATIAPNKGNLSNFIDLSDDTFVQEGQKKAFENYMQSTFTTWKDTPTEISHLWAGITAMTNDYLPYVGELDLIGKKGQFICAGFHEHGMPRVLLAGKAIASCVAQGKKISETSGITPKAYYVTEERMKKEHAYVKTVLEFAADSKVKL